MPNIYDIKCRLNNRSVTYSNVIFWLENAKTISDLINIENGTLVKEWHEATYRDGVKILDAGWAYKNTPENKNYSIEYLLEYFLGIKDIPYFENYFKRYVRVWHSYYQEGNKDEKGRTEFNGEYAFSLNYFPVDISVFLEISKLSAKDFNIDMLMDSLLRGGNFNLEEYKIKKETINEEIVKEIIALFPSKVDDYKKGKTNLINLFLGEYLKRLQDKNVDKAMLLTGIKNFIEN